MLEALLKRNLAIFTRYHGFAQSAALRVENMHEEAALLEAAAQREEAEFVPPAPRTNEPEAQLLYEGARPVPVRPELGSVPAEVPQWELEALSERLQSQSRRYPGVILQE